ncbi:MAG: hypothetical protein IT390_19620 [Nitrospira sp.]|nr:hypothetical protein [Nitrospira sp.]
MEHLHPKEAFETLQKSPNTLLIDCRTEVEFFYVGHPMDAINIEWNTAPDFEVNPHFADEVLRMAGRKDRPVILIRRSGKRSLDAGQELEKHCFTPREQRARRLRRRARRRAPPRQSRRLAQARPAVAAGVARGHLDHGGALRRRRPARGAGHRANTRAFPQGRVALA